MREGAIKVLDRQIACRPKKTRRREGPTLSVRSIVKSRLKTNDKQELILDSALDLFRHYGYRRTAMEDIARAAGVAKGTLYLYFRSKEELFAAIAHSLATRIQQHIDEAMTRDLPLQDKLIAVLDAKLGFIYRWVLSSPHAAELTASHSDLSRHAFDSVDVSYRTAISNVLREGVKSGELDLKAAGLDLDQATELLTAAAYGAEKAPDGERFRQTLSGIVGLVLRGMRA